MSIYKTLLRKIKFILNSRKWRKMNSHNGTIMSNAFDINLVQVGKETYGKLKVQNYSEMNSKLIIGSFCSIADEVNFLLGCDHDVNTISTFPIKNKIVNPGCFEAKSKGDIVIGDDVWIGQRVLILSGVKIGQGAVIGAGSVVTKDVPPYAIVGGIPAKVLKYRFSEEIREKLEVLNWNNISTEIITNNLEDFYREVTENNVDDILGNITCMK